MIILLIFSKTKNNTITSTKHNKKRGQKDYQDNSAQLLLIWRCMEMESDK
jgi:cytoplasmic iron level regulating protein YaaA (DUF328/UPF0246 family)